MVRVTEQLQVSSSTILAGLLDERNAFNVMVQSIGLSSSLDIVNGLLYSGLACFAKGSSVISTLKTQAAAKQEALIARDF